MPPRDIGRGLSSWAGSCRYQSLGGQNFGSLGEGKCWLAQSATEQVEESEIGKAPTVDKNSIGNKVMGLLAARTDGSQALQADPLGFHADWPRQGHRIYARSDRSVKPKR